MKSYLALLFYGLTLLGCFSAHSSEDDLAYLHRYQSHEREHVDLDKNSLNISLTQQHINGFPSIQDTKRCFKMLVTKDGGAHNLESWLCDISFSACQEDTKKELIQQGVEILLQANELSILKNILESNKYELYYVSYIDKDYLRSLIEQVAQKGKENIFKEWSATYRRSADALKNSCSIAAPFSQFQISIDNGKSALKSLQQNQLFSKRSINFVYEKKLLKKIYVSAFKKFLKILTAQKRH